jgi:hypothetical protein
MQVLKARHNGSNTSCLLNQQLISAVQQMARKNAMHLMRYLTHEVCASVGSLLA